MVKSSTSAASTGHDPIEDFLKRRKKATINDVAHLAQVSKKTVSRVINNSPSVREETRELVNDIIARIGFRPDPQARGLAFRRAFLFGLIYDNPNANYIVNMQMGALDAMRGTGNELVVHPCDQYSDNFLSEIREFIELQRLSGVIILPPIAENYELIQLLEDLNVPYVRVTAMDGARRIPPMPGRQVVSEDRNGCRAAGEHIASLGHTRIGFISGTEGYSSALERRAGFVEGLAAHGLAIAPELEERGAYTFDSGYVAGKKILSHPKRPSAIFASNDEMAVGVYRAAFEMGLRVPEDLSVVGFDDAHIAARVLPPLTTVRLPTRDMGRQAGETLIDAESHRVAAIIVDSELIVRGSTAPSEG